MDAEDAPPPPDLPDWCFEEEVRIMNPSSPYLVQRQASMMMESPLLKRMELEGAMELGGEEGMVVVKAIFCQGGERGASSWRGCQEFHISPYRWIMQFTFFTIYIDDAFFFHSQSSRQSREKSKRQWDGARVSLALNQFQWIGRILASLLKNHTWSPGRRMAPGF